MKAIARIEYKKLFKLSKSKRYKINTRHWSKECMNQKSFGIEQQKVLKRFQ